MKRQKFCAHALCAILTLLDTSVVLAADVVLDWNPLPQAGGDASTISFGNGSFGNSDNFGNSFNSQTNDGTQFVDRNVTINGKQYNQIIIGTPSTGFSYEFLMPHSGIASPGNNSVGINPDSGGNEGINITLNANASNMNDPFGIAGGVAISGNGTGVPTRMLMHMQIDDGQMKQVVLKDQFDKKPMITTTVVEGDFKMLFATDMRDLSYSNEVAAAPVINQVSITDPLLPTTGAGDFDMSMVERSHVSAGQFIYVEGAGWNSPAAYSASGATYTPGTYIYLDGGGFDNLNTNWASYFNYSDNEAACTGPHNERSPNTPDCPGGP